MDTYKTIIDDITTQFTEKHSRFIGYVAHTETDEEAVAFIDKIRSQHSDARHNVYAYVLNSENRMRYSDDGEPHGTAGKPILDIINGAELKDVTVVVTRYFGGILLGTGGLTRAYSKGASDVASVSKIVTRTYGSVIALTLPYTLYGKINPFIISSGAVTLDSEFSENVDIKVFVPEKDIKPFCESLVDLANGKIEIKELNKQFFDM